MQPCYIPGTDGKGREQRGQSALQSTGTLRVPRQVPSAGRIPVSCPARPRSSCRPDPAATAARAPLDLAGQVLGGPRSRSRRGAVGRV